MPLANEVRGKKKPKLLIDNSGLVLIINYLGEKYEPTNQIDLYFDAADIQKQYKVIGVMKNEGDDWEMNYLDNIKEEMIKKAKAQGGDAILFVGSYTEKVTEENSYTEIEDDKDISTTTLLIFTSLLSGIIRNKLFHLN